MRTIEEVYLQPERYNPPYTCDCFRCLDCRIHQWRFFPRVSRLCRQKCRRSLRPFKFTGVMTMQSLPTAVTTRNLEEILSTLETLPSAKVIRHSDVIVAYATVKKTGKRVKVLSAATADGLSWHVMAVQGLINAVTNQERTV